MLLLVMLSTWVRSATFHRLGLLAGFDWIGGPAIEISQEPPVGRGQDRSAASLSSGCKGTTAYVRSGDLAISHWDSRWTARIVR